MTLTRAMRVLGATSLAGALLFTGTGTASADQVREGQWPIQAFKLDKAWSVTKGAGVTVAVIDDGVDASHPDLAGQVLPGYDPSGTGLNTHPTDMHGTSMASEIAGHGHGSDNASGVVGVAPEAKILPIFKGDPAGKDAVPEDIHWAVDHGAKVINISLKSNESNVKLPEAVAYAAQHDVLIVAGAGNDGAAVGSPADEPGVLAVGAVDQNLSIWQKSNFGPEVMVSSPGVDIVSAGGCGGGSQYCQASGTSDATAFVSGTAALVRAKFPNLTAGQVANRLVKSALVPDAVKGAKLPDDHYGYGIVQPYEALTKDIPAGSAQGPLATPSAAGDSATGAPATGVAGPPVIKPARSKLPFILGGVAVLVVLAVIVIVIVVMVSRGRRRPPGGPGQPGAAPYGMAPGYPQAQQQAYGNQAPPPGYPPQQPPYGGPYQGGNQQR